MVADAEVLDAVEPFQNLHCFHRAVPGDVAENPDIVVNADGLVPVMDQRLVVRLDARIFPIVKGEDVFVTEVQV